MRNLIVQVDIPGENTENVMHGYYNGLYEMSKIKFTEYAKKVNADYLCIHCSKYPLHPTYERFQIFEEEFLQYDNILYVDCDIIPSSKSKNIFLDYKKVDFAAFSEGSVFYGNNSEISKEFQVTGPMTNIIQRRIDKGYIQEESKYLTQEWFEHKYFNAGVFLVSKFAREKVIKKGLNCYLKKFSLYDQSAMNKMIFECEIPFINLSYKYNGLFHFYNNEIKSKIISNSYFIHFCGPMKNIYNELVKAYGSNWFNEDYSAADLFKVVSKCALII